MDDDADGDAEEEHAYSFGNGSAISAYSVSIKRMCQHSYCKHIIKRT